MVEAVQYHHNPLEAKKNKVQAMVVHVADAMCYELGLGASGEPKVPEVAPEILQELKLEEKDLDEIKEALAKEFVQVADMFS